MNEIQISELKNWHRGSSLRGQTYILIWNQTVARRAQMSKGRDFNRGLP